MKRKKSGKKLILNKITIATLKNWELIKLRGGSIDDSDLGSTGPIGCVPVSTRNCVPK